MTRLFAVFAACTVLAAQTPQTPPAVFRSGATLVPLDVRVLDRSGKPITDLRQDEFIVVEDNRVQTISHFSATALTAASATDSPGLLRAMPASDTLSPQTRRVFLLMLGRGRLQPPAKGVDAMMQFVRERVLPQDQVAILAWNRATDFTTNHAGLAELLQRFKDRHEKIETQMAEWFSGLRAIYGDKTIPPHIQKQIDDVFAVPSLRPAHTIVSDPNERTPTSDELKRRANVLQRDELVKDRPADKTMHDGIDEVSALGITDSLEQFMAKMTTTNQDQSNLYAGIEYLRFIDGEKHLVFVTERGLELPSFQTDVTLAAIANNARVVVDTIQTGGLPAPGFAITLQAQSSRELSELTGGVASIYSYADKGVRKIDETTRFGYLLGYYATNGTQDGKYRRISVRVTRPGAQVLYRHGYFARPQTMAANRRDMMSYTRMSTAFTTGVNVYDIPLGFDTRDEKDGDQRVLALDLSIGLAKLTPVISGGARHYSLEMAIVCANAERKIIGQQSQPLNFTLTDELFQRVAKDGARANVSVRIPVTGLTTNVKVVVYNFDNDLLGSIARKIR
jgi:VWFA-related protein